MVANIGNFSVECDDVERAKAFYEAVFGWRIDPWGPPGYYRIITGDAERPGIGGDLRERREPLTGSGSRGFECTIVVEALEPVIAAIEANGGRIAMSRMRIEGVGDLVYFEDTEGNRVGVMAHVKGLVWPEGSGA